MACVFTELEVYLVKRSDGGDIYISERVSALLVQLRWTMRRSPSVGRVTGIDSHAFSCI